MACTVYLQNENSARLEHWLIAFLPGIAHDLGLRVPIFGRGKPTQSPKMVQNAVLYQGHLPQTLDLTVPGQAPPASHQAPKRFLEYIQQSLSMGSLTMPTHSLGIPREDVV